MSVIQSPDLLLPFPDTRTAGPEHGASGLHCKYQIVMQRLNNILVYCLGLDFGTFTYPPPPLGSNFFYDNAFV